jgi:hypothetical protein
MRTPGFAILLAAALSAPAVLPVEGAAPPFDSYKIIIERNIFDSNRVAAPAPGQLAPKVEAPPERITLTGVFLSGRKCVAFFEGSRSDYTGAVSQGDTIAGLKLVEVGFNQVKLALKDQTIELPVTYQMERKEGKQWQVSASAAPLMDIPTTETSSATTSTTASTAAPTATAGAVSSPA